MIARTSKIVLEVVIASLIGLILIAAAVAWRLTQGPVSLAFLKPEIEEALNSQVAPLHVRIDKSVLTWAGWNRPLDVRVIGVRAVAADGKPVASVPQMSVRFSGRALLDGVIAPTSLEMIGARLRLIRTGDGAIQLAVGETEQPSGDLFGGLAAAISAPPSSGRPIGYLNRVSVFRGQLTVDDRMTGTEWGAPRADVVLARSGNTIRGEFGLDLDIGGGTARIDGSGTWHPADRRIGVDASFSGLRPDRIAAKLPAIAMAGALQMPLSGRVSLDMQLDGEVRKARFSIAGTDGRIEMAKVWPSGLPLKTLAVKGQFDAEPERLSVDSLKIDLGGPTIAVRGSAVRIDQRTAVDGSATLRDIPLSALARYWPPDLAVKARSWVTEHLSDGAIEEANVDASLRADGSSAPSVAALSGTMRIGGATVRFMDGMPPLRHASATGAFTREQMLFNVRNGDLEGLSLDGGTVRLTALDTDKERASVEAVIRGPLPSLLAVIDRPRLGYARAVGIDPAKTAGETAVRLVVTLPLVHDVKFKDIDIAAAANLRGAAVPAIAFGQDLKDGTLTVKVDKRAMSVEGTATVGPAPVSLKWYERFGGGSGYTRRYEVKGTFDDAARTSFGLAFPRYLRGPVAVEFTLGARADGRGEASLRLGLNQATLAIPALGWAKPPGTDALASLTLVLQKQHLAAIPDFSIVSRDLQARGAMQFAPDGRVAAVDLKRFHLGASDISGQLAGRPDGGYAIALQGTGFDAAPLLRQSGDSGDPDLPPLSIDLRLDRLWFSNGVPVQDANGRLVFDGRLWRDIDVTGNFGEKRNIVLKVATAGATRTLTFQSSDAGAVLRALNIADTVIGGRMLLALTRDAAKDDTPWRGNFTMRDIHVVKAPILARTLSLASLTGIMNALSGKGIEFATVDVPLVVRDRVARVENARAVGSQLGLTAKGEIDLQKDRMRLDGTIVPAYTINSLLGNIPVLGKLFTGEKGSGIFAATYSMQGSLDDPKVSVNPLAALAPGFLRNLLGIITGAGESESSESTTKPDGPEKPATPAGPRDDQP